MFGFYSPVSNRSVGGQVYGKGIAIIIGVTLLGWLYKKYGKDLKEKAIAFTKEAIEEAKRESEVKS